MKNNSLQKRISGGKEMKNLGKIRGAWLKGTLLILMTMLTASIAQAATGDLVGNVTFSQNCASGLGTGITYDGANLWYSCYNSPTDLLRADPLTGTVSASYSIEGGLGSIAYDATRNVIWAANGGGSSISGEVYKIQLDAGKNVMGTTPAFNTGTPVGLVDGLGFDATVSPNQIYWSPDGSTTIYVFDVSGNPIRSFPWTGSGCYNSGVAIGGNLLFQGSDGCDHVWVVDKNTLAPAFDFSTMVSGDPNFRDEGMTCDPNTFAVNVEWSKEAYSPMRAHAFEIPKGTCGFGGGGGGPSFTVTKDFRFTNVNFTAIPAELGSLLPMNGSMFNVSYVIQPKTGTVASTNPGQLYGVVTVNGTGVQNITVADTFGTQFVVNPAHLDGGVDVLRVNTTTGIAMVIMDTQVTASTVSATGPVDLTINLTTPLASDETVMVYIKYKTSLKGLLPDYSDFVNTAIVTTNLDGSKTATATINFV